MPKYNVLIPYINPNISNRVQILDTRNKTVLEFSGKEKVLLILQIFNLVVKHIKRYGQHLNKNFRCAEPIKCTGAKRGVGNNITAMKSHY